MKGQILDFSIQNGGGLISGEDGKRYPFKSEEWKEQGIPTRGMKVDFDVDKTGQAVAVYKALGASSTGNKNGQLSLFTLFLETLTKRYAQFSGRASRREFWGFTLFTVVTVLAIPFIAEIMFEINEGLEGLVGIVVYLYWIFVIALYIPSLSVSVRRLHDTGKSGWWILISVVPVFGLIWFIVLCCQASVNEDNQWGGLPEN